MRFTGLITLLFALMLTACAGAKMEKEISGEWRLARIQHNGQFIPEGIWLNLESGNRYSSGYDIAEVPHVGEWSIQEGASLLILDSDLGEEDDSQWNIRMRGDTMILSGSPYDSTQVITMYMLKERGE